MESIDKTNGNNTVITSYGEYNTVGCYFYTQKWKDKTKWQQQ